MVMTFPLAVLSNMPQIKNLLGLPEDHYIGMMIGFGWPEIPYHRGCQRQTAEERIHRLRFFEEETI